MGIPRAVLNPGTTTTITQPVGTPLPPPYEWAKTIESRTFVAGNEGGGWTANELRSLARKNMGASGPITTSVHPGTFHLLVVNSVRSGSPTINLRNGGPTGTVIRTITATPGATIDRTSSPDTFDRGIYFELVGATNGIDVDVCYKQG